MGIEHHKDLIENYDRLWDAVIAECNRIEKEEKANKTWHGSSRSSSFTDFNSVGTILDIGQPDGTHRVYRVAAAIWGRHRDIKVSVDRWYHNNEWYWEPMIADEKLTQRRVVINGIHYIMGRNGAKPGQFNGFGGRRHDIEFFDGRKVTTYDLWYQGVIPPVFRDQLPDNARWASDVQEGVA